MGSGCGICGVGTGKSRANAHARAALPSLMRWRIGEPPESTGPRTVDSRSKLRPGSGPAVSWHTKKPVSVDGTPPPAPACATVADSARLPMIASPLKTTLHCTISPPCRSLDAPWRRDRVACCDALRDCHRPSGAERPGLAGQAVGEEAGHDDEDGAVRQRRLVGR
jgi:hypothetical protein